MGRIGTDDLPDSRALSPNVCVCSQAQEGPELVALGLSPFCTTAIAAAAKK